MPIKDVLLPLVGEPTAAAKIVWCDATRNCHGAAAVLGYDVTLMSGSPVPHRSAPRSITRRPAPAGQLN
jgi:hypothetical protein